MGDQNIVDAINFLGKEKRTNTLTTNNLDELNILFLLEVNKKLPKKCEVCKGLYTDLYTNNPIAKYFICIENYFLRVESTSYELQNTSYVLKTTSYALKSVSEKILMPVY